MIAKDGSVVTGSVSTVRRSNFAVIPCAAVLMQYRNQTRFVGSDADAGLHDRATVFARECVLAGECEVVSWHPHERHYAPPVADRRARRFYPGRQRAWVPGRQRA